MRVTRVATERLDTVELGDRLVVQHKLTSADRRMPLHLVELHERDRREHVGEVRLVTRDRDVVARAVASAHQAQVAHCVGDIGAVGRDQAALPGRDVFRRVQGEARRVADRADLSAAVTALGRMRRVLHDRNAEGNDGVEVARLAREIDRQDRLRSSGDRIGHARGIDVEVCVADVHEHGCRARVDDHVRRCRPCDRRRDHLVAFADPERYEGEVERRGPGGERQHVLRLQVLGQPPLEFRGPRSGRQPARPQRLGNGIDLVVADRRRLEAEHRLAPRGNVLHSVTQRTARLRATFRPRLKTARSDPNVRRV